MATPKNIPSKAVLGIPDTHQRVHRQAVTLGPRKVTVEHKSGIRMGSVQVGDLELLFDAGELFAWRSIFNRLIELRMGPGEPVDLEFTYADGDLICEYCGKPYRSHPYDQEFISYDGTPFLNLLCDGRRVKL